MTHPRLCRRDLLRHSGLGLGAVALSWLLAQDGGRARGQTDLRLRSPHFPARARSVILLMQSGGPSQIGLFDPKAELARYDGRTHDERVEMFQRGSEANRLLASPFRFFRRGRCGMELSEVLPHLGAVADDLCLVRSMVSEHNNHTEVLVLLNTGKI